MDSRLPRSALTGVSQFRPNSLHTRGRKLQEPLLDRVELVHQPSLGRPQIERAALAGRETLRGAGTAIVEAPARGAAELGVVQVRAEVLPDRLPKPPIVQVVAPERFLVVNRHSSAQRLHPPEEPASGIGRPLV